MLIAIVFFGSRFSFFRLAGIVANKGGQCIKCEVQGTALCFVNAHLAAHEGGKHLKARNDSVVEIFRGTTNLGLASYDLASQYPYAFWMGDLNYRIDIKTLPKHRARLVDNWESQTSAACRQQWAATAGQPGAERWRKLKDGFRAEWETVRSLVEQLDGDRRTAAAALDELLRADELNAAMEGGEVFVGWKACQPTFKPTFKVLRPPDARVSPQHPHEFLEKRIPSFCDRVLWKTLPGNSHLITNDTFEAATGFMTSDHKPVRAGFTINLGRPAETESFKKGLDTELVITSLKAELTRNLSFDKAVDVPDPYLEFETWPAKLITAKGKSKKHKLRTKHQNNNVKPDWSKETLVAFVSSEEVKANNASHLLVNLRDHDVMTKDDSLGHTALGLNDLVAATGSRVPFTEDLVMYGLKVGTVSGMVQVNRLETVLDHTRNSTTGATTDALTITGRTGKNAGINGAYTRLHSSSVESVASPTSPVYHKQEGGYFMHYYLKQWRVTKSKESIGSNRGIATVESGDAHDPANTQGNVWKIHVGGNSALDSDRASGASTLARFQAGIPCLLPPMSPRVRAVRRARRGVSPSPRLPVSPSPRLALSACPGRLLIFGVGPMLCPILLSSGRIWAFDRAVRIVRGEYPMRLELQGDKADVTGTYSVSAESEHNGSWAYRKEGTHGDATVWLRWMGAAWAIYCGDSRLAYFPSTDPVSPPMSTPGWLYADGGGTKKPSKSKSLVLTTAAPGGGGGDNDRRPTLTKKQSKKSLKKGGSSSAVLTENDAPFALPGAVSIDSFEIKSASVLVRLRSHANIAQTVPCVFVETLDGLHRTPAIDPHMTVPGSGVVELEFPALLDARARMQACLENAEHARWIGSVHRPGSPPKSKPPAHKGIRIRSIYHTGREMCTSE